ncbi:hypothetical protein [Haloglycomyces albus]|uniref:hypothetical protein n=1 Tax=Haloglycomyces albus TaxID=526067 RepID=UPI0004B5FFF2|nr:hypothetical protein [Haloglycomyces albus]
MPTVLKTLTFNGNTIDIVHKTSRHTLWVEINGNSAATVHCGTGTSLLTPVSGWSIPAGMDGWILGHAMEAHDQLTHLDSAHAPDAEAIAARVEQQLGGVLS